MSAYIFSVFLGILFLLAKYHNKKVEEERAKIRHHSMRNNKDLAPKHPTFTGLSYSYTEDIKSSGIGK